MYWLIWIRIKGFFKITIRTKEFWTKAFEVTVSVVDRIVSKLIEVLPTLLSAVILGFYFRALYEVYYVDYFKGGVLLMLGVIGFASLRVYNAILANTTSNYRLLSSMSKFITQLGAISTSMSNLSKRTKPKNDVKG